MTTLRESKTTRLLVVETNPSDVEFIGQKLRANYTHVFALCYAANIVEAIEKIIDERFDCVLLGGGFNYAEKMDLRLALKAQYPELDIPVIELCYEPDQLTARIFKAEAADCILKAHPDHLQKIIKDATRKKHRGEAVPQLSLQYLEAQSSFPNREKQIQRLKFALERGKAVNRIHEQELKKMLRRLSFQFENTPLAVIEWDASYRIRRWSKEAETLFGWKSKEMVGKAFTEFPWVVEEEIGDVHQLVRNLKEGNETKNVFLNRNYCKDGQVLSCEWCNSVLYSEKQKIESFISVVQDVTQFQRNEQLLRESQERFHKLSQASFDGMLIHDQGDIVTCNEKLAEIFGYSLEEMLGKSLFHQFTTESLAIILQRVEQQSEATYEAVGVRKDGSLFPVEMAGKPILYNNRELRITTIRDITERKKAEENIRESEVRFRSTFEQAAVGLLHVDLDGHFIRANQKICDISGYAREELLAMSIEDLFEQEHLEEDLKVFVQVLKGEVESYVSEKQFVLKNGKTRWIKLNVSRVVDDYTQQAIYFVAVVEDISERKEADLLVQQVNKDLDTFVYNASHDLRGPIASLLGLCTVADMEVKDNDAREYLSLINKTATHMNGVLLSLTLMNRVKNHKPERSQLDFQVLFDETVRSLRDEPGYENVQFSTDIQLTEPFYSDASLVSTILKNALENAIRYQSSRKIPQVNLVVRQSEEGGGLVINIQDNGVGIPAELTEKVFDMFFRATEKSTGPGLGLYVVQKIAEKLLASIHFNTAQQDVTELVISLPQMEG